MVFEIVKQQNKWNNFLNKFKEENRDIYFTYNYVKAHEKNGDGLANCCTFEGDNGMKIMYPFMITEISKCCLEHKYFDISTCYGYGGPLVEDFNKSDLIEFENKFNIWCKENNIVAEFIRFHPILNNQNIFKDNIKVEKNRDTVFVDINKSIEEIWYNSITSKNRNQIRKAQKSRVEIRVNNDIYKFIEIYKKTMERLQANDYFYFKNEYYNELFKLIPGNMIILEAVFEEQVIASSLFMHMGENIHYHLSGSIGEYMNLCPNNLMIFYGIKYGVEKGFKKLHLGGGTTDKENDSLLKFKSNFSKEKSEFFIGKRIHNIEVYELLIKEWEKINHRKAKLFLQYSIT